MAAPGIQADITLAKRIAALAIARLSYDAETGELRWKVAQRKVSLGQVAGYVERNGYRRVTIDGNPVFAHRLAWLLTFGDWPSGPLDHINGNPGDNRIANLRECTPRENSENLQGPHSRSTTGYLGVSICRQTGRYRAQIMAGGKQIRLGRFDTAEEAWHARLAAKAKVHRFGNL